MISAVPQSLRGWIVPAALVALWWVSTAAQWVDPAFLVSPAKVLAVPLDPATRVMLLDGAKASLVRYLEGVAIGSLVGIALGLLIGLSRTAELLIAPNFNGFRQVALFAWVPLFTAWFGIGETTKILLVAIAAFKPMVLATQAGVRAAPPALRETARMLCLSRRHTLTNLILPAAVPEMVTGLRLAFTFAWVATIGVEALVGFGNGLGTILTEGRENFRMDEVLFGILAVGVLGFILSLILDRAAGWLLGHRDRRP